MTDMEKAVEAGALALFNKNQHTVGRPIDKLPNTVEAQWAKADASCAIKAALPHLPASAPIGRPTREVTDAACAAGAVVMASLPSIDAPKLPAPCWEGSVRAILEAAVPHLPQPAQASSSRDACEECARLRKALERTNATAKAFLRHFNPFDLSEDKSQQWHALHDQITTFNAAAIRAAAPAEGWRPIASAPKKFKMIQVGSAGFAPLTAFYDDILNKWLRPATGDPLPFVPTHWRPLPAPPHPHHVAADDGAVIAEKRGGE